MEKKCEDGHFEIKFDASLNLECPLCEAQIEYEELEYYTEDTNYNDRYRLVGLKEAIKLALDEAIKAAIADGEDYCADILKDVLCDLDL